MLWVSQRVGYWRFEIVHWKIGKISGNCVRSPVFPWKRHHIIFHAHCFEFGPNVSNFQLLFKKGEKIKGSLIFSFDFVSTSLHILSFPTSLKCWHVQKGELSRLKNSCMSAKYKLTCHLSARSCDDEKNDDEKDDKNHMLVQPGWKLFNTSLRQQQIFFFTRHLKRPSFSWRCFYVMI